MLDIRTTWRDFKNATYNRLKYGFNPNETWSLDNTLTKFILPRLRFFKDSHCAYPIDFTPESWKAELDKMILAFELLQNEEYIDAAQFNTDQKKIKDGLESFAKYYQSLWW